eukprot:CAMPEP_0196741394 /NCGR_PEP_ID=MMETSP1091-20130531/39781_1 /TAXON_ID=302021 /ORGANISM="Rhodomonas sp., Strain CCMP768" /LENGTH=44 /DNA_ID= /DNA_START= /DNA_END= /DNA_ORIENTATION=
MAQEISRHRSEPGQTGSVRRVRAGVGRAASQQRQGGARRTAKVA